MPLKFFILFYSVPQGTVNRFYYDVNTYCASSSTSHYPNSLVAIARELGLLLRYWWVLDEDWEVHA